MLKLTRSFAVSNHSNPPYLPPFKHSPKVCFWSPNQMKSAATGLACGPIKGTKLISQEVLIELQDKGHIWIPEETEQWPMTLMPGLAQLRDELNEQRWQSLGDMAMADVGGWLSHQKGCAFNSIDSLVLQGQLNCHEMMVFLHKKIFHGSQPVPNWWHSTDGNWYNHWYPTQASFAWESVLTVEAVWQRDGRNAHSLHATRENNHRQQASCNPNVDRHLLPGMTWWVTCVEWTNLYDSTVCCIHASLRMQL